MVANAVQSNRSSENTEYLEKTVTAQRWRLRGAILIACWMLGLAMFWCMSQLFFDANCHLYRLQELTEHAVKLMSFHWYRFCVLYFFCCSVYSYMTIKHTDPNDDRTFIAAHCFWVLLCTLPFGLLLQRVIPLVTYLLGMRG